MRVTPARVTLEVVGGPPLNSEAKNVAILTRDDGKHSGLM